MNPSTALASVIVDELVRCGVREVVLSPGSRSAPLAYAVLAAEAAGRVRLHVRVDERSAGFLALGLAKGSAGGGRPVVVVTTSGTAVANLHPAVLEAHHGQVPLIVLSADRPHELRGTGANQTTHQPGIFGSAVRWSTDLPAPDAVPSGPGSWRSSVCRAVAAALGAAGSPAGPAHLDIGLREPLVPELRDGDGGPDAPHSDASRSGAGLSAHLPAALRGRPDGAPWVRVGSAPQPPTPSVPSSAAGPSSGTAPASRIPSRSGEPPISHVERTLVVVGDLTRRDVAERALEWAARRGHPVVAEPFGPASLRAAALPHGPLLLTAADWVDAHAPLRVVVLGRPTLSRAVAAMLRRPDVRVEIVVDGPWPDPGHVAAQVHATSALLETEPPETTSAPATAGAGGDGVWASQWRDAAARVAAAVAARGLGWPSGLAVASAVAESLPRDAVLVVGSSNPVRDLDLAAAGPIGGRVVANRGLAGIDGMVSTAVGVALAADAPTYAMMGDLTFLHDSGGLLIGPHEERPGLTIVVVNDDGGGIFSTLEPGAPERADTFERVFGTPTGTDLGSLCRAHGVGHELVADRSGLAAAVSAAPSGIRVVEVRVDRSSHRAAHADLRALAASALAD